MKKFVVFAKRQNGCLTVKMYDLDFFEKVEGMAVHTLNGAGFQEVWRGQASGELNAMGEAYSYMGV